MEVKEKNTGTTGTAGTTSLTNELPVAGRFRLYHRAMAARRREVFHVERKSHVRPVRWVRQVQERAGACRFFLLIRARDDGEVFHAEQQSLVRTVRLCTTGPRNALTHTDFLVVERGLQVEQLVSRARVRQASTFDQST